jgi:hypothetical protein
VSGGFPLGGALVNARSIGAVFSSYTYGGTTITGSATANTKGAYTQLTASTTGDTTHILVKFCMADSSISPTGVLIDIAVGASGSEQVIIPNFMVAVDGGYISTTSTLLFPIAIPSGTRIAARCQASVGSFPMGLALILFDGSFDTQSFAGVDAIGVSTATSVGTAVALGSGVKGSYVQITSSTTQDYAGISFSLEGSQPQFVIDVAIGASGSEVIVIPDWTGNGPGGTQPLASPQFFLPMNVPAGTRIAVRGSATGGSTITYTFVVYGLYR